MSHLRKALRIAYLDSARVLVQLSIFAIFLAGCKRPVSHNKPAGELREARFGAHGHFLKEADKVILYSLNSHFDAPKETEFHGYAILGELEITGSEVIAEIHQDLFQRIYSEPGTSITYCYEPRHGIRAYRGSKIRDYQICFQCNHLHVFSEIESDEYERIGLETRSEPIQLNAILDKAEIQRQKPL